MTAASGGVFARLLENQKLMPGQGSSR
jgi:hypothetical protein